MKKFWVFALGLFFLWGITAAPTQAALTPGTTYTITIQKMTSTGALADVSTAEAIADADLARAHETGSPADKWRL